DAAGVEGHALADEGERLSPPLAVPAHHDQPALVRRALADAEQRIHAELAHGLRVENLDGHAELAQIPGAAGKFLRIEDIRRLVDEVAGEHHALGQGRPPRPPPPGTPHVGGPAPDPPPGAPLPPFPPPGLLPRPPT